jgi:large subunit ribosomal protein L6
MGLKRRWNLVGVGYKAANTGNILDLSLGLLAQYYFRNTQELKIATAQEKGKNPEITIEGIDNQLLGQVCAKIGAFVSLSLTKGKGVRFAGEVVRRKAGKSAGK